MTELVSFFPPETIHALGWAVVHSLWQGFALALLLALVWPMLQRKDARLRYLLANLSLSLVLLSAVGTFLFLFSRGVSEAAQPAEALAPRLVAEEGRGGLGLWLAVWLERQLPAVVLMWMLGSAFFLLRLLGGYAYIQYLRHRHVWEPGPELLGLFEGLKSRLGLRRPVRLLESALVRVPMVIGHLRPVVLLPVGMMSGLSPRQVEAVLAHELGHILRNDYLWNLIQSLAETLLYFNPAVWWISGLIRTERENCCDDIAVRTCGDSLVYAKALVNLQEIHRSAPNLAMALSLRPKQHLLARVQRLLQQTPVKPQPAEKALITVLALAFMGALSFGAAPEKRPESPLESSRHSESTFSPTETPSHLQAVGTAGLYALLQRDTVPNSKKKEKRKEKSKEKKAYKNMELTIVNGEIRRLVLDGEEIPPERFHEFEYLLADTAQVSYLPPVAPVPPAPPVAPVPPVEGVEPVVPAPPAPPAPPAYEREIRVEQKGKKKKTTIIERGRPPRSEAYSYHFEGDPELAEALELKLRAQEEALRRSESALRARERALRQRFRDKELHRHLLEERERTRAQLQAQSEALRRKAEELRRLQEDEIRRLHEQLERERKRLPRDTNSTGFHFRWNEDGFTFQGEPLPEVFSFDLPSAEAWSEFIPQVEAESFRLGGKSGNDWSFLFTPTPEWERDPASDPGYLQGLLEEFRERLRDGNLSPEWLEEWSREWKQNHHGHPPTPQPPY